MKTNAIIRIILWSIVILVLLGILLSASAYGAFSIMRRANTAVDAPYNTESVETPMDILPNEETLLFSPDEVRDMEIEWAAGSILLQPADVEKITVSESDVSDEKYAMLYQLRDGKLSLQFCEESHLFGFGVHSDLSKDLSIFVPRDWMCESLEIDAAAAAVEVNDLTLREVEFDGASGTCSFENCKVDTIDMDTASGDVRFLGELNILDFDAASADIYAVLTNTPTRMDIDTMSGDLDLTLPEDTGFSVTMDTLSGSFSSDFATTMTNGCHVYGDGRCRISLDAMSGETVIRRSGEHIPSP